MCSVAISEEKAPAEAQELHEAKDLLSGDHRYNNSPPFCPQGKPPTRSLVSGSCYEEALADLLLGLVHFTAWTLSFRHPVGSFLLRNLSSGSSEKASGWRSRFSSGLPGSRLRMDLLEDSYCRQPEVSTQQGGGVWGHRNIRSHMQAQQRSFQNSFNSFILGCVWPDILIPSGGAVWHEVFGFSPGF